jgi:hypothetical protein
MTEIIEKQTQHERIVGTFGWVTFDDNERTRAVIEHVFKNGLLLVHHYGNKRFRAIVDRAGFHPDRDCYFSEGSYIDPEWEGDTARCLNYWADGPGYGTVGCNDGNNHYTDEQACQILGMPAEEALARFGLQQF